MPAGCPPPAESCPRLFYGPSRPMGLEGLPARAERLLDACRGRLGVGEEPAIFLDHALGQVEPEGLQSGPGSSLAALTGSNRSAASSGRAPSARSAGDAPGCFDVCCPAI